jgi:serine/threonine protein phosphatase PrpC
MSLNPLSNSQNFSKIIEPPSMEGNYNTIVATKKNNKIFSIEQNINSNRTEVKRISSSVKQPKVKNTYNTSTNRNDRYDKNPISKTMVHQSPVLKKTRVIKIDKIDKNLQSSGTLLTSSRSSKFNKVLKDGKKIRNIDINNESEDNQSEDAESETIKTIPINKDNSINNNSLNSNLNDSKIKTVGPLVPQNLFKDNNSENMNDNQFNSKTIVPKKVKMSKFFKQKNEKENPITDINKNQSENKNIKTVKEKKSNQQLFPRTEIISNKNKQIISSNNQSKTVLNPKVTNVVKLIEKPTENLNKNNSTKISNQTESLNYPQNQISQIPNNLQINQIIPLNKNSQPLLSALPNEQVDKISFYSHSNQSNGYLNDKLSQNIKKEDDENSRRNESNISNNRVPLPFQPLREINKSQSDNLNINSNKNINPTDSYLVSHLDEYMKNEIEPTQSYKEENISQKKEKGFRICGELTKAGKNAEGKTKTDQDTPLISISIGGVIGFNMFGVLDGHGPHGHFVSQFCKEYFIKNMTNYTEGIKITRGLTTAEEIYKELKNNTFNYITELYNQVDIELSTQDTFDYNVSGTTCNIIFQFNKHLVGCSVGDSRSLIIYDKGDYAYQGIYPLSRDHKPNLPEELERIQLCGGEVHKIKDIFGNKVGPARVYKGGCNYPGLAMSRSLGDMQAKEVGVISTPEIIEYDINNNTKYLIVCSDGVWEFTTNEQIRDLGNIYYKNDDINGFCTEIIKYSMSLWEKFEIIRDDITVVGVFF